MNICQKIQSLFLDVLENQLDNEQKQNVQNHLDECQKCFQEFEALSRTFHSTKNLKRPEPGEMFWDNYWLNLQPKLTSHGRFSGIKNLFSQFSIEQYLRAGLVTAGALIVILCLFVGGPRFQLSQVTQPPARQIKQIHQTAQTFLEKSKILLLSFANMEKMPSTSTNTLKRQKELSQALLEQSVQFKEDLSSAEYQQMQDLMSDLEVVLLQIANLDSTCDVGSIELIQNSMQKRSLLFKITLKESAIFDKKI